MKIRNYVKKNQVSTGSGIHIQKHTKLAPRNKQKIKYRKEINMYRI